MQYLPQALRSLGALKQFILYKLVPNKTQIGKLNKLPVNPHNGQVFARDSDWQNRPEFWTDADSAIALANALGDSFGVGFFFTPNDDYFLIDIDDCYQDGQWSQTALDIVQRLGGAAVEISQSRRGLHIIGRGAPPEHGCKNKSLGLEFYNSHRYVALTGLNATGDAGYDCSASLPEIVATYFPPTANTVGLGWTSEPVNGYTCTLSDDELLEKALTATDRTAMFGGVSLRDLWEANDDKLAARYPDTYGNGRAYDGSSVDAALASHLLFWTGGDCDRTERIMRDSELAREKWDTHPTYLHTTITGAMPDKFYSTTDTTVADELGAGKLRGSSNAQCNLAESIRGDKLATATVQERELLCATSGPALDARFWLDNKQLSAAELAAKLQPLDSASSDQVLVARDRSGYQLMSLDLQREHFAGCAYVIRANAIYSPLDDNLLNEARFNATYGGYEFQVSDGGRPTKSAWEAFTQSRLRTWPKVQRTAFRPDLEPGCIFKQDGRMLVNTFQGIDAPRKVGDPALFIEHLRKLFPDDRDRTIITSYLAAVVQYPGLKFRWCPVIQGVEGNGKSTLADCMLAAVTRRYMHIPLAHQILDQYNDWLFNNIFICVDDAHPQRDGSPANRTEFTDRIKPYITQTYLGVRAMQVSQDSADNCGNFMINTNFLDTVGKIRNDRRWCLFVTPQQEKADKIRDGLTGAYFRRLNRWLRKEEGFAIVTEYLATFDIPQEFNPALDAGGLAHEAPETSTTAIAIAASLGTTEQEIVEAIQSGRVGFCGDWVSSTQLTKLLEETRRRVPPNQRADVLANLGYMPHPGLKDGRTAGIVKLDGNKPRLYVKKGSDSAKIEGSSRIVAAYERAQGGNIGAPVAESNTNSEVIPWPQRQK